MSKESEKNYFSGNENENENENKNEKEGNYDFQQDSKNENSLCETFFWNRFSQKIQVEEYLYK